MPITIDGDGTITGVSVGGLPDGIVDTDMLAANAVSSAKLASGAGGKILQVVQASSSAEVVVSTATFTDIGLSASITPSSSSNKILVLANFQTYFSRTSGQGGGVKLLRGSTSIYQSVTDSTGPFDTFNAAGSVGSKFTLLQYDSPATTSSTTYKLQGRAYTTATSGTAYFNSDVSDTDGSGTLTLMEVAA